MYKKGDIVKIKDDLVVSSKTDAISFVHGMLPFISKKTKIIDINWCRGVSVYSLDVDEGYWNWTAEMFESVKPKLFKLL